MLFFIFLEDKKAEEWLCDLIIFFRIKIYFKKFDKHNLEKFIFLFVIL